MPQPPLASGDEGIEAGWKGGPTHVAEGKAPDTAAGTHSRTPESGMVDPWVKGVLGVQSRQAGIQAVRQLVGRIRFLLIMGQTSSTTEAEAGELVFVQGQPGLHSSRPA